MQRGVTVYTSPKCGTDFLPFGKRVSLHNKTTTVR